MKEQELQAIEDRCQRNQGRNDGVIRRDVMDLLAEVRRLRCCGNCDYDACLHDSTIKICDKWEAAGNG